MRSNRSAEHEKKVKIFHQITDGYTAQLMTVSKFFEAQVKVHHPGEFLDPNVQYQACIHPEVITALIQYLSGPTITDGYGANQADRRLFLKYLSGQLPDVHAWLESNRLRQNHMYGLGMLPLLLPTTLAQSQEVQALYKKLPKDVEARCAETSVAAQAKLAAEIAVLVETIYQKIQLR